MKIPVTVTCGWEGSTLAHALPKAGEGLEILGFANFSRHGSEINLRTVAELWTGFVHVKSRIFSDLARLPTRVGSSRRRLSRACLPGRLRQGSTRWQLLWSPSWEGRAKSWSAAAGTVRDLILLSTSYLSTIAPLEKYKLNVMGHAFQPILGQDWPKDARSAGVSEHFAARPPVSLYGASEVASEMLASKNGTAFGFPVWINQRSGIAGTGQFGRGIREFSLVGYSLRGTARGPVYWFCWGQGIPGPLPPRSRPDGVLLRQIIASPAPAKWITNFSESIPNAMSLRQRHACCEDRFGKHPVKCAPANRPFDVPWLVLDSAAAKQRFGWEPATRLPVILEEIARHAEQHPDWFRITAP